MNLTLRLILSIASAILLIWIMYRIKKSKVKMEDAIYWILFSAALLVMAVFPAIPRFFSNLIGIESPSNFVFVAIICLLLIKIFNLSIELSQLQEKMTVMAAEIAIRTQKENNPKKEPIIEETVIAVTDQE